MKSCYFLGDIHGSVRSILKWNREVSNSILWQVGDFCIPVWDMFNLANKLAERGNSVFVTRGNHETCDFKNQSYGDKNNLTLLADYSVVEIEGKKILNIGGGISLDRVDRLEFAKKYPNIDNYYRTDEAVVFDKNKLENYRDIDILVTHVIAPELTPLNNTGLVERFAQYDPNLLTDLKQERENIRNIIDTLQKNNKIEFWIAGHLHLHYRVNYNDTKIIGLDIDEMYQI